ncbi:MAG: DUF4347 domain-containing protein [Pleurocapsa sp.]
MSSLSHQALNNLVPLRQKDSRSIAFIDSSIADCEYITQKVIPKARAIIIGSEDDGVKAISKVFKARNCLEIHVFASGFPGCIYLGNSELSISTFSTYYFSLRNWFNRRGLINRNCLPYIYIYSYSLNIGDVGEEFVRKLKKITGAKVCTSSNILKSTILNHARDF